MDLDDLFKSKKSYQKKEFSKGKNFFLNPFSTSFILNLLNIKNFSRKIKIILLSILVLLIVIIVLVIVLLLPLIIQFVEFIYHNGISGLLDVIVNFLQKLWYGAK